MSALQRWRLDDESKRNAESGDIRFSDSKRLITQPISLGQHPLNDTPVAMPLVAVSSMGVVLKDRGRRRNHTEVSK